MGGKIAKKNVSRLHFLITIIIGFAAFNCHKASFQTFPVQQVVQLLHDDSSVVLLDVRTREEFKGETGHLIGAVLIPVQELERRVNELEQYRHRTIIAYCRAGRRSATAAQILTEKGFVAINMDGGMVEWRKLNLPVAQENK